MYGLPDPKSPILGGLNFQDFLYISFGKKEVLLLKEKTIEQDDKKEV
jgi:hypothetical protein